ncbi:hypothetical protein Tco_0418296 [Tanacetum coccineum]
MNTSPSDVNPLVDEELGGTSSARILMISNLDESYISVVSILEGFTDEPPLEENDDLFDWILNEMELAEEFVRLSYLIMILMEIYLFESLARDDTTPSPPPEVFLDRDPRSLRDINDLKIMVKNFDPGIHETIFSLTYVSLPFEYRHYLTFTYVIQIFLPYFTYSVNSSLPLSSGSEDIIFDPGISVFSLKPVAYEFPMEVCSSTCFIPNITMIWGESS